jgi:hypothetical protein
VSGDKQTDGVLMTQLGPSQISEDKKIESGLHRERTVAKQNGRRCETSDRSNGRRRIESGRSFVCVCVFVCGGFV